MDPLALLREYSTANKLEKVVRCGSRIDFDDSYSFESSTLTRFRSRGGYYNLGTVFFFLKNKSTPYGQYFQNAKQENLDTVAVVDKKALIDYIEGKIEGCPQIDTAMPNLPVSAGMKRTAEEGEAEGSATDQRKQQRVDSHKGEAAHETATLSDNPEDWSVDQIYAQEKETFSTAQCMRVGLNFSYVCKFARELLAETGARERPTNDPSRQPRTFLQPIILVPHGMTAVMSMYNVKEFLENGKYVFPEQIYKTNHTREIRAKVKRSFQRKPPVSYMVSEKIPNKQDSEVWKRVAAVVVSGKPHQFKDYPFKGCAEGDVYDMLHNHVQGFYFQYHDDNFAESEAANWKVEVLSVHRHHRHGDNLLMQQFWNQLDAFMVEKKLDRVFRY